MLELLQGYINSGNQEFMLDNLRWIADYFVKCHHADLAFTGQVGDTNADHNLWERPEDMKEARPSADLTPSKPGAMIKTYTQIAQEQDGISAWNLHYD